MISLVRKESLGSVFGGGGWQHGAGWCASRGLLRSRGDVRSSEGEQGLSMCVGEVLPKFCLDRIGACKLTYIRIHGWG
jgi:hypothetical protein